jgi:cytochrome P450
MQTAPKCPFPHAQMQGAQMQDQMQGTIAIPAPGRATDTGEKRYTVTGGPKGLPILGNIIDVVCRPLDILADNAIRYGDIIPISTPGMKSIQLNHPDLIRHVLIENHKNYHKSMVYKRFEPALGHGILTSNGEKWRRDRQTIQPMFRREQIEGYYFDIVNEVSEKYKHRWLALTENGSATIDMSKEMAFMTMEIVLKALFGKSNLDSETIASLHAAFNVGLHYQRNNRVLPNVDFRKLFKMPAYFRFRKAMDFMYGIIDKLSHQYKSGQLTDQHNMLALLLDMQKQDPEHFTDQDIKDQAITMIFAGFETTANTMQWIWYALDIYPEIRKKVRMDIVNHAPCTATFDSTALTCDSVFAMSYLHSVFRETQRVYPSFWLTSRQPLNDDYLGDYKVERGTVVVLPHIIMHRHPRFWDEPNAFIPERFSPENEPKIDPGLYFPFSLGPRKCIGFKFAEMETKAIIAKFAPLFNVKPLNTLGNPFSFGVSLRFKHNLLTEISRV